MELHEYGIHFYTVYKVHINFVLIIFKLFTMFNILFYTYMCACVRARTSF